MKIRSGFVSNSSSSSFIIGLDNKPTSVKETEEMFYPNVTGVRCDYIDEFIPREIAAGLVFAQLENQDPMKEEDILEEILQGYFLGFPDYDYNSIEHKKANKIRSDYTEKTGKTIFDNRDSIEYKEYSRLIDRSFKKHNKDVEAAGKNYFNNVKELLRGKQIFVLSFSDNDGTINSVMEHGTAFKNVPHITISHH